MPHRSPREIKQSPEVFDIECRRPRGRRADNWVWYPSNSGAGSMKKDSRASKQKRVPRVKRIDGARHWPKTLDQIIWLLLRGGIAPDDINRVVNASLHRHRETAPLTMPAPEVLEYSRILTHWQNEPRYLDETGNPLLLKLAGRRPSFSSLVRESLSGGKAASVLDSLLAYRLVARTRDGKIRMLETAFLPRGDQQAQFLAYTLSSLEGIVDTCYANLTTPDRARQIGQLQRVVLAERFDMKHLAAYDRFLRESAEAFSVKHDAWLKRREVKDPTARGSRVGYVGVGIFGFVAR